MHVEDQIAGPAAAPSRRVAPTKEARTARTLLVVIPAATILLAVGARVLVTSDAVTRAFGAYVAREFANRTRSAVQMSGVTFDYGFAPCFHDFEMYRFTGTLKLKATTKEACVERWASAIGSGLHAVRIRLKEPSIRFEGSGAASAGRAFVDVKPQAGTATAAESQRSALREIQVVFDDLKLDWSKMPVPERVSSGTFGPIDGMVTVQIRDKRTAATLVVREPRTGTTINGRINPTDEGWDMSAGVEGDLVPIFGTLLRGAELDIRKMPTRGRIGAVASSKRHTATIDLDLEQYDVDLANRLVSSNRLSGFTAREKARVEIDTERSVADIKDGVIEVNGIPVTLSLKIAPGEASPAFEIRTDLRTTPLIRLLRSVPDAQEPEFAKRLSPSVLFAFSFSMSGVMRDPGTWQPKLEERLAGIGPNGAGSGIEFLRGNFRYYPLTAEGRAPTGRVMGPASPSWQPLARIPYVQKRAVIVSEDSSFYFHQGIDISEIQEAIRQGMTNGEKTRGGSTLTQQLVKNLFLSRDRTALRKLQEALLTFHVEASMTKDQIFELYMNIIEWGPNIYGLKEAAQHYFGKKPESLNPREMAYLAAIIPGPISAHGYAEQGYVPPRINGKIDALLERLNRLGQLSDEAYAKAKETKIYFARRK